MTITTNIEKTARTARQTAEMQRNSYEVMAKNISALQRRNVEFAQMWMTGGFELMRAYQSFVSPFSYAQRDLKAAQQTAQHAQQELEATQQELQAAQRELRVAEEATVKAEKAAEKAEKATVKAEKATVKAEKATVKAEEKADKATAKADKAEKKATAKAQEETREAALEAAVQSSLKTKDYEELNVDEVAKKLDGLSAAELEEVREYEKRNKNRETLVEQIDRKDRKIEASA
jgi:DNA repair exonuclease SbcCD ATPase subunit